MRATVRPPCWGQRQPALCRFRIRISGFAAAGKGIYRAVCCLRAGILPLCECKQRRLLFVYRPASLKNSLSAPQAAAILRGFGYDTGQGLDGMLAALRGRFAGACGFPHEIGLFLDYPPKDVQAFIETGGEGCKLCGYWKVYHDVEAARERFACFDACRACLGRMLAAGNTISQLLCAA